MKKFAVVLSGCGVNDGSEIHESVLCMLAMSKHNIKCDMFAPDMEQYHVVDHLTGEVMDEKRNVLTESARIARGDISDLKDLNISDYDGLILPGGFGVAKNLSTYAFEGVNMKVIAEIEKLIIEANELKKPIGAVCISPIVVSKVLKKGLMTVGKNDDTGAHLHNFGTDYCPLDSSDVCVDKENMIFTVPAYMNDASLAEIYEGIEKLVIEMSASC